MLLEGSCHCGAVRFSVQSDAPCPYMLCYCSICRKTAGAGGFAINLSGDSGTLEVTGREHVKVYRAWTDHPRRTRRSVTERYFCGECGSALWAYDERWPELVHPHASAVDTPLPVPPERNHVLLDSRANWVPVPEGPRERHFPTYPDESIHDWHVRHGLLDEGG